MIQINISQIENGFLVALPPGKMAAMEAVQRGQQPQPTVKFAKDFEEVVNTIKEGWPVTISKVIS